MDTSSIADSDGLTNVAYKYQWLADDGNSVTDISGATDSTYTLAAADAGLAVKEVTFIDDADHEETLTSSATAEVTAAAPTDPPGSPRSLTATANPDGTVTLSWDGPDADTVRGYQILRRRPRAGEPTLLVHVNDTGSAATEYTDHDVTPGLRHAYRVKAINAAGLSSRSNYVNVTPTQAADPAQNNPATGRPAINGTAEVGETLTANTASIADADGLTNVAYSYQWLASDGNSVIEISGGTDSTYTLAAADAGTTIKVKVSFTDDASNEEALTSSATDTVSFAVQQQTANNPATGAPRINGTAEVGETLTVDTSSIADSDGLTNVAYRYQWLADDGNSVTEISGATDSTYTLAAADAGLAVKVTVTFIDDADHEETLTSSATAAVTAAAPTDRPGSPRSLTATANPDGTVTLSWDGPDADTVRGYQILRRRPWAGEPTLLVHVNDTGSAATEYTDHDVTPGLRHAYRVKAINAAGLSSRSNYVNVTPTQAVDPAQDSPATGRPAISGTAEVGETLTANTASIADADGLTNVAYSYQWIISDGGSDLDITSATDSTYTLVAADKGLAIKVKVSFTDDAGNEQRLTSTATGRVAARVAGEHRGNLRRSSGG